MIQLPVDFADLMRQHYGTGTADALCEALTSTAPEVSVRINFRKVASVPEHALSCQDSLFSNPVPWCKDAYYLTTRPPFTFDPMLHAGAYYVQEASSMYVATLLEKYFLDTSSTKDDCQPVALDLCAAPGGKSTLLAGILPAGSLVVCNEPIARRAQILAENVQKWAMPAIGRCEAPEQREYPVKSIVTNNYPADFGAFTGCFDLLVADVPCSGEGMFRKDRQAIDEWSIDNVIMCAERQRSILQDIWHVLKPGGLLVYSTCTFNRFEDDDNAMWICEQLGGELMEQRHFLPGRDRGEGFYCCAIRKDKPHPSTEEKHTQQEIHITDMIGKVRNTLRVIPQAFMLEGPPVELNYEEALQYLRREAIRVPAERGMVTLCYKGLPLGPGKCVGSRINNLYPEQWRIRSTYTQKWSLFDIDIIK